MNLLKILLIISVIGIFLPGILGGIYGTTEDGSKVDCFDKYGNKIIGAECISDGLNLNPFGAYMLTVMILSFFLAVLSLAGMENNHNCKEVKSK